MALCVRQCANCPMTVTVRIDFADPAGTDEAVYSHLRRQAVLDCYSRFAGDKNNAIDDMAIILHVDGADIEMMCSYADKHKEASAIEFF